MIGATVRVLLVVALVTGVLAGCGDDDGEDDDASTSPTTTSGAGEVDDDAPVTTTAPATSTPPSTSAGEAPATTGDAEAGSVELVAAPLWPSELITEGLDALEALADRYLADLADPAEAEIERFLFGYLPAELFGEAVVEADPGTPPTPEQLWMFHLSGYFGGRWLRGEIAQAQPDAPLVGFSQEPTEEGFRATEARLAAAVDAVTGDDEAALAYAELALFGDPADPEDGGLVDNFGYNQGYLLEIIESPPEGLEATAEFLVTCGADRPLACDYATERIPSPPDRATVQEQLAAGTGPYADLAARILPVQAAAVERGRGVWSIGLSVQGFPQVEYDQLLDVSSSFLETVEIAAVSMAAAVAEGDVAAARRGAAANALLIVWLDAYSAGLIDGREPVELPTFTR